jgi:hypothetical protein
MDSRNFSYSSFTPSYNVSSWGNVTNILGQSIGSVDRFGTFRDNYHPDYSFNVDRFGTISNGFNGLGTQFGSINNFDSYQRSSRLRDDMSYLKMKEDNDYLFGRYNKPSKEYYMPKIDPIIIPEPKYTFQSPASSPLFPYFPEKKKKSRDDDYSWLYKF